ncbi:hypothetical protein H8356DRAFT_1677837 [Neocallimastix lanati (nom. inval.)]|uniref:Thioredoxin fold domain-containing protein n=1 Tax=Neocallimastix californiae TaxID=1754190 RepID=A0A1Y2EN63_9FUNG|nr:hypothetical protein H8356DRAFT_1677837 [Neocallimastix sp. JGI-2020a]ORY72285.1 thioredoxin fold domain-containing protein [Neocallimastix californiae]|eukprot:ORY72285.1 thioredoxin fold domain-containing protein [Neocallimastix californiae]
MKVVQIKEIPKFDEIIKEQVETGNPVFAVFLSDIDPETNQYWCPDCVQADPYFRKAVGSVENSILVECFVGPKSGYKNVPTHPYRVHPKVQLKAIPTIMLWKKDGPAKKLIIETKEQCETLDDFVKSL